MSSAGVEGQSPAHSPSEQPLNGSTLTHAAMGQRGKDRRSEEKVTTGENRAEKGALITVSNVNEETPSHKKTKKASVLRSRGMILFVVFMALLLDETLMTVIVPIIPDYLVNRCVEERCMELNTSTAECNALASPTVYNSTTIQSKLQTHRYRATTLAMLPGDYTSPAVSMLAGDFNASGAEFLGTRFISTTTAALLTTNDWSHNLEVLTGRLTTRGLDVSSPTTNTPSPNVPSLETLCEEEVLPKSGILFASKFFVRIALSPFVGSFAHKIGFPFLLISGCVIMIISSFVFAFGVSYEALLTARVIHGLGATLNEIGGIGLLALRYRNDEKKRGFALGLAIGGFAAGTLIGPPLGGICYNFLGKPSAFLIMVGFFIPLGVLEVLVLNSQTKLRHCHTKGTPLYKLVVDPYMLATAGGIMIASGVVALLEPTLPIWMRHNIYPPPDAWQIGAVFLPSGLAYVVSSTVMGFLGYKIGRWSLSLFALVALALSVASVPYPTTFLQLVGPMVGTGFGFGTADSTLTAMLNSRVDARHKGAYGGAAAISTFAFCLGFAIGPSVSGFLTNAFGFKWLMRGIAIITLIYAPICIFLRNPNNTNHQSNSGNTPRSSNDVTVEESLPVPSISRRLSRV